MTRSLSVLALINCRACPCYSVRGQVLSPLMGAWRLVTLWAAAAIGAFAADQNRPPQLVAAAAAAVADSENGGSTNAASQVKSHRLVLGGFQKTIDKWRTPTTDAYDGLPLAQVDASSRSAVLATIARVADAQAHPHDWREDMPVAESCEGAEYGWIRHSNDGKVVRVGVRVASLVWSPITVASPNKGWRILICNLKLDKAPADELLLALYTPAGVYVYKHNKKLGVYRNKMSSETLALYGEAEEENWHVALHEQILPQLDAAKPDCARLDYFRFTDATFLTAFDEHDPSFVLGAGAFVGVPLSTISTWHRPTVLDHVLKVMARAIDEKMHAEHDFETAKSSTGDYDWGRLDPGHWLKGSQKIRAAPAKLKWVPSQDRWRVRFVDLRLAIQGVRKAKFDELLLTIYAPNGVYVYKHDGEFGVSLDRCSTSQHLPTLCVCVHVCVYMCVSVCVCVILCSSIQKKRERRLTRLPPTHNHRCPLPLWQVTTP